jgi:choline kinase
MKVIILAAGQGTRLRPLTDTMPKCMVEVAGQSIIKRQLAVMRRCNISEEDIFIVCGYKQDVLKEHLAGTKVSFIINEAYESTNMVCSLMCAKEVMNEDIIISYGDIVYGVDVLKKVLTAPHPLSVVIDDGWYGYWKSRCADPLSDAETLKLNTDGTIIEIGQKPKALSEIESQYIGLMRFQGTGLSALINLAAEAKRRSDSGIPLWRTTRNYQKMYMTDLLQGLADTGEKLQPIHINRGWFEVDNLDDLQIAEEEFRENGKGW